MAVRTAVVAFPVLRTVLRVLCCCPLRSEQLRLPVCLWSSLFCFPPARLLDGAPDVRRKASSGREGAFFFLFAKGGLSVDLS
jgi:hypothetical protein